MLEDQLAGPTLRLSGGRWTSFVEQGEQAGVAARMLSARPDVLALSAGGMVALSAPAGRWHRLAAWSAVVDESTVRRVRERWTLSWHFGRSHERAFRTAGVDPPRLPDLFESLFRNHSAPRPSCACLFVHADDDPVAPALAVRSLIPEALIACWGGHLGFGAVLGAGIYSRPLIDV